MPRFAANLSYLFLERAFLDRFAAARRAGFAAVEFHFPYACSASQIAAAVGQSGVDIVLFNLPAGDWSAGERGIACHPDRMDEFRAGVRLAIDYARALRVPRVNCLAGLLPENVAPELARETLLDNLRFAAAALAVEGIGLVIEPINTRDMPGFFVSTATQALELIDAGGSDNLSLQFDIYHARVMAEDLTGILEEHHASIGHIQLADYPGRHEPGSGEIDFPFLFDRLGYDGWVGCEYVPATTTEAGFGWLRPWLRALNG
jgi:hydroxypyruvate isomerase